MLSFESWWFEGGQRVTLAVDYNTATCICTSRQVVTQEARKWGGRAGGAAAAHQLQGNKMAAVSGGTVYMTTRTKC